MTLVLVGDRRGFAGRVVARARRPHRVTMRARRDEPQGRRRPSRAPNAERWIGIDAGAACQGRAMGMPRTAGGLRGTRRPDMNQGDVEEAAAVVPPGGAPAPAAPSGALGSRAELRRWALLIGAGMFATTFFSQPGVIRLPLQNLLKSDLLASREGMAVFFAASALAGYFKPLARSCRAASRCSGRPCTITSTRRTPSGSPGSSSATWAS